MVVLGRVQFRLGDMGDAEEAYHAALQIDSTNVDAYLGLAHLYRAYSLYAHAYAALKRAHDLDPHNPDIQLMWMQTLPRHDRLAVLEAYMSGLRQPSPGLQRYESYLKKTQDEPPHSCKVASNVEQTEIKLEPVHDPYPHIEGLGLELKVNDRSHVLLLDTGASGVLISRKAAEKAGLRTLPTSLSAVSEIRVTAAAISPWLTRSKSEAWSSTTASSRSPTARLSRIQTPMVWWAPTFSPHSWSISICLTR
jgi:tetratricopeptide (TPR) repeat protein